MDIRQKVRIKDGLNIGRTGIIIKVSENIPISSAETLPEGVDMMEATDKLWYTVKHDDDGTVDIYSTDSLEVIE